MAIFNESGWVENLPELQTGRWLHGCGHYLNSENNLVRNNKVHIFFNSIYPYPQQLLLTL